MQVEASTYIKGLVTYIPGARKLFCSRSGGTVSARYCYAVWMRHLVKAQEAGLATRYDKIAELGPGDSLGIGLCAVLCGAKAYSALDTKPHANMKRNRAILDELITLFKGREPIPDITEFPDISPALDDYSFPDKILTDPILGESLHPDRLGAIHTALSDPQAANGVQVAYIAPWQTVSLDHAAGGLDLVFSQAVMEHVEQVEATYAALYKWLRPGGFMSHTIDYKSHGYTRDWNGHWTLSEFAWRILKGNRPYLINRLPHSAHIEAMKRAGFRIVSEIKRCGETLPRHCLAGAFRAISDDDLRTSGAYILALKP